jgi:threonine dehydrogenase-like Zn-dependent dehydrogenase
MKSVAMAQVADRQFDLIRHEVPPVRADEALLRVEACGLCGSDLEQYRGKMVASGAIHYPIIPGHEPVGIIEELGAEAARTWGVKRGDRVALQPALSCTRCFYCGSGRPHLCKSVLPSVTVPSYGYIPMDVGHGLWGGYSQYIHLHARTQLYKLPTDLPLAFATLYQPLAGGLRWAVQVPQTAFDDTVLVLSCGQRGLAAVVMLRAAGVRTIIVTGLERDSFKLALARQFGASHTIIADRENTVERVMEITGGRGVDVVLDLTPSATQPVADAVEVARPGGTIVLAGLKGAHNGVTLNTDKILFKELTLKGVFTPGAEAYGIALEFLSREFARLAPMHTHSVPLEKIDYALSLLAGEVAGEQAICVSVHPPAS